MHVRMQIAVRLYVACEPSRVFGCEQWKRSCASTEKKDSARAMSWLRHMSTWGVRNYAAAAAPMNDTSPGHCSAAIPRAAQDDTETSVSDRETTVWS
eukprot:CAMPEP_0174724734 /NCGR_PEP_ID=MMETSP1094-20130205/44041_1 /TAXON_ID=156173 /ORGANISM="Chrysochromulina brevifilum, Strain UTEX LB 985" /LENGTH=96 /DNA_ID=CAMNT_0015925995 /DNA_START=115 /DNA_END=406 /DNA_ORIENTATION=+